jgi:uncharacterized membrane protein YkvI
VVLLDNQERGAKEGKAGENVKQDTRMVFSIAFTYIGTIVGAGFATGQEILQFFTRFGGLGAVTIGVATGLFVWLGAKMMLVASRLEAKSYEAVNMALFGERIGRWISYFMMVVLLGVSAVMLAGVGALFEEQLHLPYQLGLITLLVLTALLLKRGMTAILALNSVVVPIMLTFTILIVIHAVQVPTVSQWISAPNNASPWMVWMSPFLYTAFNLALAQAVLVPLGGQIRDERVIRRGAVLGGVGIGFMLLVGHIALSTYMPDIARLAIPMGGIARMLYSGIQWIYVLLIFTEIFTTLVADIYGLTLQALEKSHLKRGTLTFLALAICYLCSLIGFEPLLSTLYPIFGVIALGWLVLLAKHKV